MINREKIEDLLFETMATLKEISFYYVISIILINFKENRHFLVWIVVILALKKGVIYLFIKLNINNTTKYGLAFIISIITVGTTMKLLYNLNNQELLNYIKYPIFFILLSYANQIYKAKSYNKILKKPR